MSRDPGIAIQEEGPVRPVAGRLLQFGGGRVEGELTFSAAIPGQGAMTIEILAQGLPLACASLPPVAEWKGDTLGFAVPIAQFPPIRLPFTLTARITETDAQLESELTLTDVGDLWRRMAGFVPRIGEVTPTAIELRVAADGADLTGEVFELRDGVRVLGRSSWMDLTWDGDAVFRIPMPAGLLDEPSQLLSIVHPATGLLLGGEALRIGLVLESTRADAITTLERRVAALEAALRRAHADAFQIVAQEFYRHVDAMVMLQRANFQQEIAALRQQFGVPLVEAPQPSLPREVILPFDGPLTGYGIHKVEFTSSGKAFRFVAPLCGLVLPAIQRGPAALRIQGIRRALAHVLDGTELLVNGSSVQARIYVSQTSESWNIEADLPARLLRNDRNLLELRFPRVAQPGSGKRGGQDNAAGVLFVSLAAQAPAQLPDA